MRKKILVIEDNEEIRENVTEMLTIFEYEVLIAENGEVGISKAFDEQPDLILCDILMPRKNGFQVLKALRDNPTTVKIPFVFLTSSSQKRDIEKGNLAGADDYLVKPFKMQQLLSAIKKILSE